MAEPSQDMAEQQAPFSECLLDAAESGDLDTFKLLYNLPGINRRVKSDTGVSALMVAASKGKKDIVRFLLTQPDEASYLNDTDKFGWTALLFAAKGTDLDIFTELYNYPVVDRRVKTKEGVSVLMIAAGNGKKDIVRFLLTQPDKASHLDDRDNNGWTALHFAATGGDLDIFTELYNHPEVDKMVKTNAGSSIIMIAARKGKKDIVRFLLTQPDEASHINNTNNTGWIALHFAAKAGDLDTFTELYNHSKVDRRVKTNAGSSIIMIAALNGKKDIVKFLLTQPDEASHLNDTDKDGWTALHYAAQGDDLDTFSELYNHPGVDRKVKTGREPSVLRIAAAAGKKDIVQFLISKPEVTNSVETCLNIAVQHGHHDVVKLDIQDKADVDACLSFQKKAEQAGSPEVSGKGKSQQQQLSEPSSDLLLPSDILEEVMAGLVAMYPSDFSGAAVGMSPSERLTSTSHKEMNHSTEDVMSEIGGQHATELFGQEEMGNKKVGSIQESLANPENLGIGSGGGITVAPVVKSSRRPRSSALPGPSSSKPIEPARSIGKGTLSFSFRDDSEKDNDKQRTTGKK